MTNRNQWLLILAFVILTAVYTTATIMLAESDETEYTHALPKEELR